MNSKWALLVPVGRRPEAVVSSVWAFARAYGAPSVVCLFPSRATLSVARRLCDAIRELLGECDVRCSVVDEASIEGCFETVASTVRELKAGGCRVAVDVTPGRKTMSIAAYRAALEAGADLVLYLHLKCREFEGTVLPLIPKHCVELVVLGGGYACEALGGGAAGSP